MAIEFLFDAHQLPGSYLVAIGYPYLDDDAVVVGRPWADDLRRLLCVCVCGLVGGVAHAAVFPRRVAFGDIDAVVVEVCIHIPTAGI